MAKVIDIEKGEDGNSYRIDFGNGMVLWFDTWTNPENGSDGEHDLMGDWNKYIFNLNDANDVRIKEFQEAHNDEAGAYNYAAALEACEEYESSHQ